MLITDPDGPKCGVTGLLREECYHCPLDNEVTVEDGQFQAPISVSSITEAARRRLLKKHGWFAWPGSPFPTDKRCCGCHRVLAAGDPVTYEYGNTLMDLKRRAWCCETIRTGTVDPVTEKPRQQRSFFS